MPVSRFVQGNSFAGEYTPMTGVLRECIVTRTNRRDRWHQPTDISSIDNDDIRLCWQITSTMNTTGPWSLLFRSVLFRTRRERELAPGPTTLDRTIFWFVFEFLLANKYCESSLWESNEATDNRECRECSVYKNLCKNLEHVQILKENNRFFQSTNISFAVWFFFRNIEALINTIREIYKFCSRDKIFNFREILRFVYKCWNFWEKIIIIIKELFYLEWNACIFVQKFETCQGR